MDVLVTGADSELGRMVAGTFKTAGHRSCMACGAELELVAKELDVDAVVCDNADPVSLLMRGCGSRRTWTPSSTSRSRPPDGDPRAYTLGDHRRRVAIGLDRTVLSAVLTVQLVGDNLRSGGSIVTVVPDSAADARASKARSRPP